MHHGVRNFDACQSFTTIKSAIPDSRHRVRNRHAFQTDASAESKPSDACDAFCNFYRLDIGSPWGFIISGHQAITFEHEVAGVIKCPLDIFTALAGSVGTKFGTCKQRHHHHRKYCQQILFHCIIVFLQNYNIFGESACHAQ